MIPSNVQCSSGCTRGYYAYLLAGSLTHKAAIQHTCVDESLKQIWGSGASTDDYIFSAQLKHFVVTIFLVVTKKLQK